MNHDDSLDIPEEFSFNFIEYEYLRDLFSQMSKGIEPCSVEFKNIIPPTKPSISIPGSHGSMEKMIEELSNTTDFYNKQIHSLEDCINTQCYRICDDFITSRNQEKQLSKEEINRISEQEKELKQTVENTKSALLASYQKVVNIHTQAQSGKLTKSATKSKITAAYQHYMTLQKQYLSECEDLDDCINQINQLRSHYSESHNQETFKLRIANESLKSLLDHLDTMGKDLNSLSQSISTASENLDFSADYHKFIDQNQFKFYDTVPFPFERFKFSSQYVQPDVSPVVRFKMLYFPLSMAEAIGDFTAEDEDEMSLVKGQRIFLMEEPINGWILSLRLSYQKFGYIPETYVKKVGIGLGVAPNTYQNGCGFIVAIMEHKEKQYICEDSHHQKYVLDDNTLYIL